MSDRGRVWVWPTPTDESGVPDYPPAEIGWLDEGDGIRYAEGYAIGQRQRLGIPELTADEVIWYWGDLPR